ncbi:MAG TPA: methyltransferase domain-containing protein [Candidatus Polarisedimenticolia bacterium]|nr:methyltransferase domain-containing protein [Candidatus Polarisedimenticolia bacterium]
MSQEQEKDYVLGTHDEEIERLGLQHRVWRPRVLDAWRRAGLTLGQTIVDVGCGPGFSTLDLAGITGPAGRVVAVDRSRRFLAALEEARRQRGIGWIEAHEQDLDLRELPVTGADAAWSRWVLAFVKDPHVLVERIARALRPGGTFVSHEYVDYGTWRFMPRSESFERFVALVMEVWRESGGEPDIGLDLPGRLQELGFEVRSTRPLIEIVPPSSYVWHWPRSFVQVGLRRLVDLGRIGAGQAAEVEAEFAARQQTPGTLMITPLVLETIAVRR